MFQREIGRDGYSFMTRYVLAVLYFATLGDRWVYALNFGVSDFGELGGEQG